MRDALIDDVSLGRMIKDGDGHLWLGLDPEVASIRPYRGLSELWQMVSRSAFVQLQFSYLAVVGVLIGLGIFFCGPPVMLALGLAEFAAGHTGSGLAAATSAALAWGLQTWMLYPYVRHHRCPKGFAALLPLASALYGGMTVSSAWNHLRRRGSRWKGRGYTP